MRSWSFPWAPEEVLPNYVLSLLGWHVPSACELAPPDDGQHSAALEKLPLTRPAQPSRVKKNVDKGLNRRGVALWTFGEGVYFLAEGNGACPDEGIGNPLPKNRGCPVKGCGLPKGCEGYKTKGQKVVVQLVLSTSVWAIKKGWFTCTLGVGYIFDI